MAELRCLPVRERGVEFTLCWPDDRDYQYRQVRRYGRFYEFRFLRYIAAVGRARNFRTCFDIGTCFGNHAVYFGRIMGCHVECFEPNRALLDVIAHNLVAAGVPPHVHDIALSAGESSGALAIAEGNLGASRLVLGEGGDTRVVALDTYWVQAALPPPDFIKIDTEGFECAILRGAHRLCAETSPDIFIEIARENEADTTQLLSSMGYARVASFARNHHFSKKISGAGRWRFRVQAALIRMQARLAKKWTASAVPSGVEIPSR